jgi:hypothetical protein
MFIFKNKITVINLHAFEKNIAPYVTELTPFSCWLNESKTYDFVISFQWHKIDINFRFAGFSVPKLKETLRNAHRTYVSPMNLVSVFETDRKSVV